MNRKNIALLLSLAAVGVFIFLFLFPKNRVDQYPMVSDETIAKFYIRGYYDHLLKSTPSILLLVISVILLRDKKRKKDINTKKTMKEIKPYSAIVQKIKGYLPLFKMVVYPFLAVVWIYINWDAICHVPFSYSRIDIQHIWVALVPAFFLIFCTVFPSIVSWLFVVVIFIVGWGLQFYKNMQFAITHMGVKTDLLFTIEKSTIEVFLLILCLGFLYVTKPEKQYNIMKYMKNI